LSRVHPALFGTLAFHARRARQATSFRTLSLYTDRTLNFPLVGRDLEREIRKRAQKARKAGILSCLSRGFVSFVFQTMRATGNFSARLVY
jgi:ABC-type antimicrobial peptide transport system permease subunit